jgi:hypothetical protein
MFKNKKMVSVAAVLIIVGLLTVGYSAMHKPDPKPHISYHGVTFTYPTDWQVTNKQLQTDASHTIPSIGIHTKDSIYYVLATLKSKSQAVPQTNTQSEALLVSATRLKGLKDVFDLRWIVHEFGTDTSVYSSAEFLISSAQYSQLHWSATKATPTVAGDAPAFKLPSGTELTVGTNSQDVYPTPQKAKAWFFTASGKQAHAILMSATLASAK